MNDERAVLLRQLAEGLRREEHVLDQARDLIVAALEEEARFIDRMAVVNPYRLFDFAAGVRDFAHRDAKPPREWFLRLADYLDDLNQAFEGTE
jgi:hypothetical protein